MEKCISSRSYIRVVIAVTVGLAAVRTATTQISLIFNDSPSINRLNGDFTHNSTRAALAVRNLASPETAAAKLQDPQWISKLQHHVSLVGGFAKKRRRVLEWTVESDTPDDNGIELLLMPAQDRGFQLIELFLEGRVDKTMGENVAMMGWAKAALALGCNKVVMFDSYVDFVNRLDKRLNQFYMMDYLSLPELKDDLLLDPMLRQRTWELAWWGRASTGPNSAKEALGIGEKYGFKADHALVPFNYTDGNPENIRMALLPTAITFNHMESDLKHGQPEKCHVFYMGKSVIDVQNSTTVIKIVEQKLSERDLDIEGLRLCTAFEVPEDTSYEEVLGFRPKYTVNVGRMKPNVFAYAVGNAKVVVGSGFPYASPTIVDAIFGGAVFMAPAKQFKSMDMHPLFIKADETFSSPDEEATKIISILLEDKKQLPFGGFHDTSYSLEHACRQLLEVIAKSFMNND